jgi:hypothetical protein
MNGDARSGDLSSSSAGASDDPQRFQVVIIKIIMSMYTVAYDYVYNDYDYDYNDYDYDYDYDYNDYDYDYDYDYNDYNDAYKLATHRAGGAWVKAVWDHALPVLHPASQRSVSHCCTRKVMSSQVMSMWCTSN